MRTKRVRGVSLKTLDRIAGGLDLGTFTPIVQTPRRAGQPLNALLGANPAEFDVPGDSFAQRFTGLVTPGEPLVNEVRHVGPQGWTTSPVDLADTPYGLRGTDEGKSFLMAIDRATSGNYRGVADIWESAGLRVAHTSPSGALQAAELGRPTVLSPNPSMWGPNNGVFHHAVIGTNETHVRVFSSDGRIESIHKNALSDYYRGGYVAEHPDFITKESVRPGPSMSGNARPIGLAAGGALLGMGLAQAASDDGHLPEWVGDTVRPVNQVVAQAFAPFSPTQGVVGTAVKEAGGSHLAAFGADLLADGAPYAVASMLAGAPAAALVGALSGAHYLAEHSEFAHAGRATTSGVSDLGIDTSHGTFGQALASELRGATSGVTSNAAESQAAVDNFGQLYTSAQESGADLALKSSNGWGAIDEARREQLLTMQDLASKAASDENLVAGAVFYPDGTSAQFQESSYTNALQTAQTNGHDGSDLGMAELQRLDPEHVEPKAASTPPAATNDVALGDLGIA